MCVPRGRAVLIALYSNAVVISGAPRWHDLLVFVHCSGECRHLRGWLVRGIVGDAWRVVAVSGTARVMRMHTRVPLCVRRVTSVPVACLRCADELHGTVKV
jgi:hypothetical protein